MASKTYGLKLKLLSLSLLSISLSLLVLTLLTSILQLKNHLIAVEWLEDEASSWPIKNSIQSQRNPIDLLVKEFKSKEIKIGLVNINEEEEEETWKRLGQTSLIQFDQVSDKLEWKDFFPEWINEERWPLPRCPEIPMPVFEDYGEFDIVVSRVPCGSGVQREGIRDVFRLQVNLVVANLVVKNGRKDVAGWPVYVVFMGSCGPMWEIFRCDDLWRHEGEFWIHRPDLRRLKQKVLMPVGTCRLAVPYVKQGEGRIKYEFSKLGNPIDHPREAYVTMLHSSEDYVCGAIVLAQSIIQNKSTKDLVLLADESITGKSRQALKAAGWKIKHIERIRSPHAEKKAYNKWNYSKLRVWQLTEYDKIIFIDADLILLKNMDKFFVHPQLSAVGNDNVLFNSGVMLIEPSECMFEMLMKKRHTLASYNGGDQGFLNEVFTWWHRWPKTLNFLKFFNQVNETNNNLPNSIYAIHYLGLKPWMCDRDYDCNWDVLDHHFYASNSAHKRWWQVHDAMPKSLRSFCRPSKFMDLRKKLQRLWEKNARLPDGHGKRKVKDPRRQH